ncbi:glycoside hydrolase family 2 TIM barrel-domain containing protein [Gammaproteobacteria bacterium]|nr:glycoside hydrolase family 2 TIM barrel-domain containing protein [Gammaproteobacteria bacterium]
MINSILNIISRTLLSFLIFFTFNLQSEDQSDANSFFEREAPVYPTPDNLIGWIDSRQTLTLNGEWSYIIDPMNNGLPESSFFGGFPKNKTQKTGMELIEYNFETAAKIQIPGAWNAADEKLFFYRGPVWLYKKFKYSPNKESLTHLYIEGSNFTTRIFINGSIVGKFEGGYVPFNFEISDHLKDGDNILLVQTDNSLNKSSVPTQKTDWWPWGGIVGDVYIVETPKQFIRNAYLQLNPENFSEAYFNLEINNKFAGKEISLEIPELQYSNKFITNSSGAISENIEITPQLWSPANPKLYEVIISSKNESINDEIGFRSIKTQGQKIYLNNSEIRFKGIAMHSEPIGIDGPAFSQEHFKELLSTAKELNINFVRAAHYPYTRHLAKVADRLGLMLWEEVPVYWNIDWDNSETLNIATNQITRLVQRDKNRASVVVWSVANETPLSSSRMKFLNTLLSEIEAIDSTRLTTAALLSGSEEQFKALVLVLALKGFNSQWVNPQEKAIFQFILDQANIPIDSELNFSISIDDPLGESVDLISYNEYFGWYYVTFFTDQMMISEGTLRKLMFEIMPSIKISSVFNKPIHISEFGAGAKYGNHSNKIWSEEYQAKLYKHQLEMLSNNPQIKGISPWVFKDFRAMLRPLPGIQDFYNRKGLIDENGNKKEAFAVLADFYENKWKK